MAEKMKNSSMKQAPKGRMPAMRVQMTGCMYHTWPGTCGTAQVNYKVKKIDVVLVLGRKIHPEYFRSAKDPS